MMGSGGGAAGECLLQETCRTYVVLLKRGSPTYVRHFSPTAVGDLRLRAGGGGIEERWAVCLHVGDLTLRALVLQ